MKHLDVVRLIVDLPCRGRSKGEIGTIVHEHVGGEVAYEVEFTDPDGSTLDVLSLRPSQLSLVWSAPWDSAHNEPGNQGSIGLVDNQSGCNEDCFTYASFLGCNKPRTPTQLCYMDVLRQSRGVSDDFCKYFTRIFNPVFVIVEGNIYVEVCFNRHRLMEDIARGVAHADLPYWHNLLEVTGLCEDMEWKEVCELAYVISNCWNSKLNRLHPGSGFESTVFIDDELDEVFVALYRLTPDVQDQ